jgi:hypothetical protein
MTKDKITNKNKYIMGWFLDEVVGITEKKGRLLMQKGIDNRLTLI